MLKFAANPSAWTHRTPYTPSLEEGLDDRKKPEEPPSSEDAAVDAAAEPHADGPEAPHWLWWNGRRIRIGSGRGQLLWKLLEFFWSHNHANVQDLIGKDKPWPDPVGGSAAAAPSRARR